MIDLPAAVFEIVSSTKRSADSDAGSSSGDASFYDAVPLADGFGRGVVNPGGINIIDKDAYADVGRGNIDNHPISKSRVIRLDCHGISSAARAKLRQWMLARKRVLFDPPYGANTTAAWSAGMTGSTDHIGNTLTLSGEAADNHTWDDLSNYRAMRTMTSKARVVATPFGAGQVFEAAYENDAYPSGYCYPQSGSSGAANSGWVHGSAVTSALITNMFPHSDCPDVLRVTTPGADGGNYIYMNFSAELPTSSTDRIDFGVFLKGRVPSGAKLNIKDNDGGSQVVATTNLDQYDLSDWTMVRVSFQKTWVAGSSLPNVILEWTTGSENADFMVGPVVAKILTDNWRQLWSNWIKSGVTKDADYASISRDFRAGCTRTMVFHIPEWFQPVVETESRTFLCGVAEINQTGGTTNNTGKMTIYESGNNDEIKVVYTYYSTTSPSVVKNLSAVIPFTPGGLGVVSVVFRSDGVFMWYNGSIVAAVLGSQGSGTGSNHNPGPQRVSRLGYGAWPMVPMLYRTDSFAPHYTDSAIKAMHAKYLSPGAWLPRVAASGREFYITAIPGTLMPGNSGLTHHGVLELTQAGYDESLADYTSREDLS